MSLTPNDLESRGREIYWDDADADAIVTGAIRLMSVTVTAGAAAVGSVIVNDALTKGGGGTAVMVSAVAGDSRTIDFAPLGVSFTTGISSDVTGAGAAYYATYLEE